MKTYHFGASLIFGQPRARYSNSQKKTYTQNHICHYFKGIKEMSIYSMLGGCFLGVATVSLHIHIYTHWHPISYLHFISPIEYWIRLQVILPNHFHCVFTFFPHKMVVFIGLAPEFLTGACTGGLEKCREGHAFVRDFPRGSSVELRVVLMKRHGDQQQTSGSRTVGYPLAIFT